MEGGDPAFYAMAPPPPHSLHDQWAESCWRLRGGWSRAEYIVRTTVHSHLFPINAALTCDSRNYAVVMLVWVGVLEIWAEGVQGSSGAE